MKKYILLSILILFSFRTVFAAHQSINTYKQQSNESIEEKVSKLNLPVIHINTKDGEEPTCNSIEHPDGCIGTGATDNHYIKGEITIHKEGNLIFNSGEYSKNKSGMRIKVRGNSSATLPYKSFKVKLEVKHDLFNRNEDKYKDKNWALLNIMSTRDLRTVVGFYVGKLMGMKWEPEYQFVNLFVNGDYRGLYMLSENVKVSEGRCALSDPSGLLIEADPYWWNEDPEKPVIKTNYLPYAMGYTFKNPDLLIGDPMLDDIKNYLNEFEYALYEGNDISKYVDIKSFATWILAHDLLGTLDGAGSNYYVLKDDFFSGDALYQSKLCMGPLWDFDTIFEKPGEWCTAHDIHLFYYKEFFKRLDFVTEYYTQWMNIHNDISPKVISFVEDLISKYGEAINESRKLAPKYKDEWVTTVDENLTEVKNWFENRIPWMDKSVTDIMNALSIKDIQDESTITSVTIYNIKGHVYDRFEGKEAHDIFNNSTDIAKLNLQPGVYILRATYDNESTKSKKYIKF